MENNAKCTRCKETKPLTEFRSKRRGGKLTSQCQVCLDKKEAQKKKYEEKVGYRFNDYFLMHFGFNS